MLSFCSCSSVELIGHYFTRTRLGLYHVKEIGFGVWVRNAFGIKVGFRVMIRDIIGCLVPRVEPLICVRSRAELRKFNCATK